MEQYVLDSSAIIAYFNREKGAEVVKKLLTKASITEVIISMHNATVAEVYYDALYKNSTKQSLLVLQMLFSFPINFVDTVSSEMIKSIGYFKTNYQVSFADSFVLATGKINNAKVITSDHHEFDAIEKSGDVGFEWIR